MRKLALFIVLTLSCILSLFAQTDPVFLNAMAETQSKGIELVARSNGLAASQTAATPLSAAVQSEDPSKLDAASLKLRSDAGYPADEYDPSNPSPWEGSCRVVMQW